ncbi:DegT/DnrJ/EryC1/StrS family aminotransferase [Novosphingobium lentum]|uniref:DegT/DnrJ/EryC1/StrS family aminotransferase n=1 Tax=Novosphingobium lentum TaxID=145287 RepID=UPI0008358D5E|nr:DegT/DnrJ/EryC1/StrS family aminotransferase [Novosphingobium lentum]
MAKPELSAVGPRATGRLQSLWPRHDDDEIDAVVKVLRSGRVNALVHGDQCRSFEQEFADFTTMPFAIAVANGTVSLELALRALGVRHGDEVIVPARSFFATASSVAAVGADPVFADIVQETQNIDPASIARMIGPRTRAVICVHLAGRPCDMGPIVNLCREQGLVLIEDCAQAHGALYRGQPVGSFGDASSFSFCTDKIMSTGGEGGMVLFRQEEAWARAFAYKDHGKDPYKMRTPVPSLPGQFRFLHDSFGTNFRITELQAAIGRVQLAKLPGWLDRRRQNAATLASALEGVRGMIVDPVPVDVNPAWYKFYARYDSISIPGAPSRDALIAAMLARGIACGSGSCPDMSRENAFAQYPPRRDGDLPEARRLGQTSLMFAVDHLFEPADMEHVGEQVEMAFRDCLA